MIVTFNRNEGGDPEDKLADVELVFTDGALAGLKPVGFAIWRRPRGTTRWVTFPARVVVVRGERRSYMLLRPASLDEAAVARVRQLILDAYDACESGAAKADSIDVSSLERLDLER